MRFSLAAVVALNFLFPGAWSSVQLHGLASKHAAVDAKTLTPPSKDPFYKAPAGFQKKPLGAILKHRNVPTPLLVGPSLNTGDVKAAFQILYRTTDGLGNPEAALTTLIIPHNASYSKHVSYQTFYDAADVDCSPSYTLQKGSNAGNIEGVIISTALRQRWIVSVPDYEGPKAAFTVGKQAGRATLDSVRAVLASKAFSNISSNAKTTLFGYSGGALASEWAVELQPSYAPNLKIAGAAFGGLTPNVTNVIITVNNQSNSNLIPVGVLGFANQYANVSSFLARSLKPSTASAFKAPLKSCSNPQLSNKNILAFFKQGKAVLNAPILKSVVQQNGIMGLTNTPKIPLYIFKSAGDEVSPVKDTDALVAKYCKNGASIRYIRNSYGTHETEFIIGLPKALRWIKARLDGKAAATKCSTLRQNVSKLNASSASILGEIVYQELKAELASFEGGGK